jgi:hypothetical protein
MATIDINGFSRPGRVPNELDTLNSRHALRQQYVLDGPSLEVSLDQIVAVFGESVVAQRLDWVIDTPDGRALLTLGGPMSHWSVSHPGDVHGSWLVIGESPAVMAWIRRALTAA